MEQILISNLPASAMSALGARAAENRWSLESEARAALIRALADDAATLVDLLAFEEGAEIEFEPGRLGLTDRSQNVLDTRGARQAGPGCAGEGWGL